MIRGSDCTVGIVQMLNKTDHDLISDLVFDLMDFQH